MKPGIVMTNLLNTPLDYQVTKTSFGTRKRFLYESGQLYSEYISFARVGSWPLVHMARGRSPETGRSVTARGFIAIGRKAVGVVALGQMAVGVIAVGQFAVGALAVGQFAGGILFGLGQFATGLVAIGQFAAGAWSLGQASLGNPLSSLWNETANHLGE